MHELMKKSDLRDYLEKEFIRSKTQKLSNEAKIKNFKAKIADDNYLDHAIQKIATDLTHFLLK